MTRHHLTPKNPETADTIVIGYDRPLRTFFAQVYKDRDDAEPTFLLMAGYQTGEHPYAHTIIDLVSEYAYIPEDLYDALDDDRACAPFRTIQEVNTVTHWSEHGLAEPVPAT